MKKLVAIILSLVVVMGLCACGDQNQEPVTDNSGKQESVKQEDKNNKTEKGETNPYTITVNGKEYSFPMSYDEFLALGWDSADAISNAEQLGEYTLGADCSGTIFAGGGGTVYKTEGVEGAWLHFYNDTTSDKEVKDCKVIGLSFDERLEDKSLTAGTVKFKNKDAELSVGESTIADTDKAFGEPTYKIFKEDAENTEFINEKQTTYMYESEESDNHWLLYLYFNENDTLEYFTYHCNY